MKIHEETHIVGKVDQSWIFKSFSVATAIDNATIDAIATTANGANKTWIFKLFSRNA